MQVKQIWMWFASTLVKKFNAIHFEWTTVILFILYTKVIHFKSSKTKFTVIHFKWTKVIHFIKSSKTKFKNDSRQVNQSDSLHHVYQSFTSSLIKQCANWSTSSGAPNWWSVELNKIICVIKRPKVHHFRWIKVTRVIKPSKAIHVFMQTKNDRRRRVIQSDSHDQVN